MGRTPDLFVSVPPEYLPQRRSEETDGIVVRCCVVLCGVWASEFVVFVQKNPKTVDLQTLSLQPSEPKKTPGSETRHLAVEEGHRSVIERKHRFTGEEDSCGSVRPKHWGLLE